MLALESIRTLTYLINNRDRDTDTESGPLTDA
jgi:hypothetical protein